MKQKGREFQLSLFDMKNKKIFGGSLLKNSNPKEKRPISTKHPMHIVIRSTKAKGQRNFLTKPHKKAIKLILEGQAKSWGIRLYRFENVGNHIHILLRTGHRKWLSNYLRSITGLIARQVLGAERGKGKDIKFWDARPFSRVITWGRAYKGVHKYFDKNKRQAMGLNLVAIETKLIYTSVNSS